MSQYRDPLAGLRSQIATKQGLLESRERNLPALLRAMLPPSLQKMLDERAGATRDAADDAGTDSLEKLSRVDAALDELLRVHEEAAALVPKLRVCPDEVPDPPRPAMSPPWIYEEAAQLRFRAAVTERLAEVAPEASVVRWDDTTYLARFPLAGAPLVASARYQMVPGQLTSFRSAVRTSVPPETPALEVRRSRVLDGIGRVLGLGEPAFHPDFTVDDGGKPAATGLLTEDVTESLVALAALDPKLRVRRGVVDLSWVRPWPYHVVDSRVRATLFPDPAFAVVLGVRAAVERA